MMPAELLTQLALQVLQVIYNLGPYERAEVLHVANSIVQTEIAQLNRPKPVRDE